MGRSYLSEGRRAGETGPVPPRLASWSVAHSRCKHLLPVQLAGYCPGQWQGKWAPTSSCPGSSWRAVPGAELARGTAGPCTGRRAHRQLRGRELQPTGSPSRPGLGNWVGRFLVDGRRSTSRIHPASPLCRQGEQRSSLAPQNSGAWGGEQPVPLAFSCALHAPHGSLWHLGCLA